MTKDFVHTQAKSADEYIGAVYGSAALSTVASIMLADLYDEMEGRTDYLSDRRIKRSMSAAMVYIEDIRRNILGLLADRKADGAWMADFGMAVYNRISTHLLKLTFAVAQVLGRHKGLRCVNTVAKLVVTQTVAEEAMNYAERRAKALKGCYVTYNNGRSRNVGNAVMSLSCRLVNDELKNVGRRILVPVLPPDTDLGKDVNIANGMKIVLKTLIDMDTWAYARDKADELNGRKGESK